MELLTLEQIALHVSRGHFGRAGLPRPHHGPLFWQAAADRLHDQYALDPLAPPEEIARAEAMHLAWVPGTGTCGASVGRLLLVAPAKTPFGRWCGFHHERGHAHGSIYLAGGNEGDLWGFTLELLLPRRLPVATLIALTTLHRLPREILERRLDRALLNLDPDNDAPGMEHLGRVLARPG